jgi:iron-sulfur cluster repair protein YtfE (RIC family)
LHQIYKAVQNLRLTNFNEISLHELLSILTNNIYPQIELQANLVFSNLENIATIDKPHDELPSFEFLNSLFAKVNEVVKQVLKYKQQLVLPFIETNLYEIKTPDNISKVEEQFKNIILHLNAKNKLIQQLLHKLRAVANNYSPIAGLNTYYQACYCALSDYEQLINDLIYTEELVLFPKFLRYIGANQ